MKIGTITLQLFKKNEKSQEPLIERMVIMKAVVIKKTIKSNNKNKNLIKFISVYIKNSYYSIKKSLLKLL